MTDAQLLEQFEQLTLPFELWTHQAHVRVAFIYLQRSAIDDAPRPSIVLLATVQDESIGEDDLHSTGFGAAAKAKVIFHFRFQI